MTAEPTCARCGERKDAGVHDTPEVCEETRGPCLDPVRHHPYSVTADPTTEAGRSLLAQREAYELWHPVDGRRDECALGILAIEAEARAPLEARVRELEDAIRYGDDAARMAALNGGIR